jgi:plastocyanin
MSLARRTATALLLGALCAACALAAPALVADAAGGHPRAPQRTTHRSRVCRHPRRRHCPASRAKRHAIPPASGPSTSSSAAGAESAAPTSTPVAGGASGSDSGAAAQTTAPSEAVPAEAPAGSASAPGPARVQVTAKEYSFTLSRSEVPAGKVIVEFVNGGEDPHNLHLTEPVEGAEAGAFPKSSPGFHGDLTLNLHPGTYTLFCSLPGHEAKGMKATLTVR